MNFNLAGGTDSLPDSSGTTPLKSKFRRPAGPSPLTSSTSNKATSDQEAKETNQGSASKEGKQSKFKQRGGTGGRLSRSNSVGESGEKVVSAGVNDDGEGGEVDVQSGEKDNTNMPPPRSLVRPNPLFAKPSPDSTPTPSNDTSTATVFQKTSLILEQKRQQKLEKKEREKLHSKGEGRALVSDRTEPITGHDADEMELDDLGPDNHFFQSNSSLYRHSSDLGRLSNDFSGLQHHHRHDANDDHTSNLTPPTFKVPGKRKSGDGSKKSSKNRRKSSGSRSNRENSMVSESEVISLSLFLELAYSILSHEFEQMQDTPPPSDRNSNYDYSSIDPFTPIPGLFPGPNPHVQHAQAQVATQSESEGGDELRKKWEGCTKEEWEQGGVELGKKFGDLLQKVMKLVQRKAERNATLKGKMQAHKQELDQRKEQIEETSANLKKWGNTI